MFSLVIAVSSLPVRTAHLSGSQASRWEIHLPFAMLWLSSVQGWGRSSRWDFVPQPQRTGWQGQRRTRRPRERLVPDVVSDEEGGGQAGMSLADGLDYGGAEFPLT